MTGYTLDGVNPKPMPVADSGTVTGPPFVMKVPNVELRIPITPGDYPGISAITLKSPTDGNTWSHVYTGTLDEATDVITFQNVAPEIGAFRLSFSDQLHADVVDRPVLVPLDLVAPYSVTTPIVTTTGDLGRLQGTVTQRNDGVSNSGLQTGGAITINRTSVLGSCGTPCNVPVTNGMTNYQIDLLPGSYEVVTTQSDFQTQRVNVVVPGGRFTPQNLSISKFATFNFIFTNNPLPPGTTMVLSDGVTNYPSTTAFDSGTGRTTFTFKVPAQTATGTQKTYVGTASAPGYATRTLPAVDDVYSPEIGSVTTPAAITLAPRVIDVNVTNATGAQRLRAASWSCDSAVSSSRTTLRRSPSHRPSFRSCP